MNISFFFSSTTDRQISDSSLPQLCNHIQSILHSLNTQWLTTAQNALFMSFMRIKECIVRKVIIQIRNRMISRHIRPVLVWLKKFKALNKFEIGGVIDRCNGNLSGLQSRSFVRILLFLIYFLVVMFQSCFYSKILKSSVKRLHVTLFQSTLLVLPFIQLFVKFLRRFSMGHLNRFVQNCIKVYNKVDRFI